MMEFIYTLIFGFDYPGLTFSAIDPLTMALIGKGLTSGIQGLVQRNQGKKRETAGQDIYDKQLEDFRSGMYDLGLGQGVYDAYTGAQNLAAEAGKRTAEAGQSAMATNLAAARYGDPRMAFLTPKTTESAIRSMADANLTSAREQSQLALGLAGQEQGIKSANEQMRQQLESMHMARGAGMMDQGFGMRQQGVQTMVGGFGDAMTAYAADPSSFGRDPKGADMSDYMRFLTGSNAEEGGRVPKTYEDGGRTMITPGEPSHETNPIHMINNNGEKVGEAMGGELVFDDTATALIIEALKANDPQALFEIIKKETSQPQFMMDEEEMMA